MAGWRSKQPEKEMTWSSIGVVVDGDVVDRTVEIGDEEVLR